MDEFATDTILTLKLDQNLGGRSGPAPGPIGLGQCVTTSGKIKNFKWKASRKQGIKRVCMSGVVCGIYFRGRTRTGMLQPAEDFESSASTSFTTPAYRHIFGARGAGSGKHGRLAN